MSTKTETKPEAKTEAKKYEVIPEPNLPMPMVIYSNSLNNINFGTLKSNEQNLIFSIFVKVRNKGNAPVEFSPYEISQTCLKNLSLKEMTEYVTSLKNHFFKLDFSNILQVKEGIIEETYVNFFKSFTIKKNEKGEFISLIVEVNERFEHLVNKISSDFTAFELANFLVLDSKYAKTLFRLLKQYKSTGEATFNWKEFKEMMAIPNTSTFTTTRIKNKILIPAIKEISYDSFNIFKNYRGSEGPSFKNLTFSLIKKDPTKKTSPVTVIMFRFTPEEAKKKVIINPEEKDELLQRIDPDKIYSVEEVNNFVTAAQRRVLEKKADDELVNKVFKLLQKSMDVINRPLQIVG